MRRSERVVATLEGHSHPSSHQINAFEAEIFAPLEPLGIGTRFPWGSDKNLEGTDDI